MTSLPDRPGSALLVVDVQHDVVAGAYRRDEVVATIAALVQRARAEGVPVVWVQDFDEGREVGSPGWELVPELARAEGEPRVDKTYGDAFAETDLEPRLAALGVGRLVLVGAQTDACIRSTLHSALVRGYDVTLVADAHTTEDLREWGSPVSPEQAIGYTNLYAAHSAWPGCRSTVVPAAEVVLTAAASAPAG